MASARTLDQPGAMAGAALSRDADAQRQRTDSYDARSDPLVAADDDTDDLQRLRTSGLSRQRHSLQRQDGGTPLDGGTPETVALSEGEPGYPPQTEQAKMICENQNTKQALSARRELI